MRKYLLPVCTVVVLVGCGGVLAVDYLAAYTREVVKSAVWEVLDKDSQNIGRQMSCLAREATARLVIDHMSKSNALPNKFALLDYSLENVDPKIQGLYCEFGVWTGETVNYIAERIDHPIHGFDSFEGLPETWRTGFEKGTFKMTGLPPVRDNVKLHQGWFDASVPVWAAEYAGPVSFIHMDADLYSSTKTVLDILGDRIVPGTVIQFDEFFNYPGWQDGEYKAFMEFVAQRQVEFEYLGYCYHGQQVSVKILRVGRAD